MTLTVSILAILAFGITRSFMGGIFILIVLMAVFVTVATDFGFFVIR